MSTAPELAAWLKLTLTPGMGPALVRQVLSRFGLPEAVLAAPRRELGRLVPERVCRAIDAPETQRAVDNALAWLERPGCTIVTLADADYPRLLLEIPDPPSLLYLRGRRELLCGPGLAVVGSRNATPLGMRTAELFARALGEAGLRVVSGLALGIDAAAHRGGLTAQASTVAVLGTGADRCYPAANATLADQIARDGLLISELPLGSPPRAHHFPLRNRLLSGLSLGVLVVEAAIASGSLLTARSALEQGREVFAIPGSIHSPMSKGCHALIKSGAKLVETVDDILIELRLRDAPHTGGTPQALPTPDTGPQHPVLAFIGPDPVSAEELCALTGLSPGRVAADLLDLELSGRIATLPGGRVQKIG